MLMGLAREPGAGDAVPLVLDFASGEQRRLSVVVKPLTWSPASE